MPRHGLGDFEHLILLAVLRLGEDAYGVSIIDEVESQTGRSVTQAAAYLTLKRLEKKGWISSKKGAPTLERGGRAKRYYRVAPVGLARLKESRTELMSMWSGVSARLD